MSEYSAIPSTGKLKLKGVKDAKIDKKKKKRKPKSDEEALGDENFVDKSVVLKQLEHEDEQIRNELSTLDGSNEGKEVGSIDRHGPKDTGEQSKTEAERRYDEQRRKRLEERLKREGVKTHKERVEELNRYLSTLSEHHDMPKIGPG